MGINCCGRAEDPSQLENCLEEVIYPVNSYIKDSVRIPEEYLKEVDERNETFKPQYIPDNSLHCRVFACYDENLFNLWVDAGTTLQFFVTGTWYLFEGLKKISSDGDHENQSVYNFPLGCLLGRIQGGPLFEINNKSKYTSRTSGSLVMFQNNGSFETNPFGYLEVYVIGAKPFKRNEIEKLLGWDIGTVDTTVGSSYLTDKEKDLLILINKLRHSPGKFADKYLSHLIGCNKFYEDVFKILKQLDKGERNYSESTDLSIDCPLMLKPNYKLDKLAKKHGKDLSITGELGHISIEGLKLEDRLRSNEIFTNSYSEMCCFGKSCPISILLQLILDDDEVDNSPNRETIILGKFNQIGIAIQNHKVYGSSCIITLVYL